MLELFKRCLSADYIHTEAGTDYAVDVDNDTIYLCFEWSDGIEDWKSNFNFPAKAYKNGGNVWLAHRGFLAAWKDVRDEVEMRVSEILAVYPLIKKIVCIGYSHGAALAVLCTEDMEYLYGKALEVSGYGYGTPRALWGIVPRAVKNRLRNFTSIRNIPDIVTHVPPMVFGFRNAGKLVKVGKKGKYSPIKAHYASAYIDELMKGG